MLPDVPVNSLVRWTQDGKSLAYVASANGVSNIAVDALATPSGKLVTHFQEDLIFYFDISRTSGQLALVRGVESSDILLLEHAR
jgi:hypothetical protein